MRLQYTFKGADSQPQLVQWLEEKLAKLAKLEVKPFESAEAIFRHHKDEFSLELKLHGGDGPFESHGKGETFTLAMEETVDRLEQQMRKHKERVKNHKSR